LQLLILLGLSRKPDMTALAVLTRPSRSIKQLQLALKTLPVAIRREARLGWADFEHSLFYRASKAQRITLAIFR
jgi:hypothetical protein